MKQVSYLFLSLFLLISCAQKVESNSITTKELKELLSKEKIQLLDVRTQRETDQGSINTALFTDYFDANFAEKAASKLDKNKPVYLYCRTMNRSGKASKILKEAGFETYYVIGGYSKWKSEN